MSAPEVINYVFVGVMKTGENETGIKAERSIYSLIKSDETFSWN